MQFAGANAPAVQAHLISPLYLATDRAGDIFVSDSYYQQVFKIAPGGAISVFAGNGAPGFSGDGGPATAAQLSSPSGLAVDSNNNLYIGDYQNSRVRVVTPDGNINTYAVVTGGAYGLALDSSGNLYVTTGRDQIVRISPARAVSLFAGTGQPGFSGDGGPALSAQFFTLAGLKVDATGNVFVADSGNERIRRISSQGIVTTVAGNGKLDLSGDNGPATSASVYNPRDVAVDASGKLYISEGSNFRIRVVNNQIISEVAGGGSSFSDGPAVQASLLDPGGLAIDAAGNLLVAVTGTRQVRLISQPGSQSATIGTLAGAAPTVSFGENVPAISTPLLQPGGTAVDATGNLYIADTGDHRLREVNPAGLIHTAAGDGIFNTSGNNGPATNAEIGSPGALAFDAAGDLFITSGVLQTIRKISAAGIITTFAGGNTGGFSGDGGSATFAQLFAPAGLAVDAAGNLYIADSGNNRIRRVNTSGTIATIAGTGTGGYSGDGGPARGTVVFATPDRIRQQR